MLKLNTVMIFSENPKKLADFYRNVFEADSNWAEGDFIGFKVGDGYVAIGPHDKVSGVNLNPERILINFESQDVTADFNRIKLLGARVVAEPYHPGENAKMSIATFADPDNNLFQITSPMSEM